MSTNTDFLGRVLQSRYRLEAGLGSGGFANVFLAYDLNLERRVAVKLLHSGLANDEQFFNRFRAEARAAAMLNHPNIVQVYDWGEDLGEPFLVLEYLAGGSLQDLLNRTKTLDSSEVAQIGAQAARGLAFAHHNGLIHRDIKPANLLFDEHGAIHIADFGLARALVDAAWTEPMGLVFGTARYASPEQAKGESVDQRSDVYSLALVCYEALVGESPFRGDTPLAALMTRVHEDLPYSPKLEPFTPILMHATRADVNDRLDAASFASEFELLSHLLPTAVIPIEPHSRIDIPTSNANDLTTTHVNDTQIFRAATESAATDIVLSRQQIQQQQAEKQQAEKHQSGHKWRWIIGLAALLVILLGGGAVSYVHFSVYSHVVPKLVGATTSNAEKSAKKADMKVGGVQRTYSATVPVGVVLTQSVKPGTHVKGGAVVSFVVSSGHAPSVVSNEAGQTQTAATAALKAKNFQVKVTPAFSETVPAATVISSSPNSGKVPFGSTVTLQVSQGPQPRTIPNLAGQTYAQAKQALTALRLGIKQSLAYSNTVASGVVIASSPASGATGVPVGTVITVSVSQGPQYVSVPAVAGDSINDAVAAIQAAGLTVTEQIGPPFASRAVATNPAAGTQVVIGSGVTLYAA